MAKLVLEKDNLLLLVEITKIMFIFIHKIVKKG